MRKALYRHWEYSITKTGGDAFMGLTFPGRADIHYLTWIFLSHWEMHRQQKALGG